MKVEVFEHSPGLGDYGTDWRRIYTLADLPTARHCAGLAYRRDGVPLRLFSVRKAGVGKLIEQYGSLPEDRNITSAPKP